VDPASIEPLRYAGSRTQKKGEDKMNNELISHITEELKHVHADIEHVGRDLEELTSHLKNLDEHLHHLMDEADKGEINPA
jgi:predicted transcriptional regulator